MNTKTMFLPRKIYPELKRHINEKQVTVITGMRRAGKTTLVKELFREIDSTNKIYIDLQRLDYRAIFEQKNFDQILRTFETNFNLRSSEKMYIVLDEIQFIAELPGIVKYLYDHYDIKFIVTGSSSFYLKNHFTESMAGRKKIFELYPLDFGEFLDFKGISHSKSKLPDEKFSVPIYENWHGLYEEYIEYGGFPEVVLSSDLTQKKDLLADIIGSYISVDVQSLSDFKKKDDFYSIIKMLSSRIGTRIDYTKLSKMTGLSSITLRNYMSFFEDTYLISQIPVFTRNTDIEIVKAKKLFFIDTGLANVLSDLDSGAKFENTLFNQLRHQGAVSYYARKDGREIDFILEMSDQTLLALEAKETPTDTDLSDLQKLTEKLSISQSFIVGKNRSPKFEDYIWGGSIR